MRKAEKRILAFILAFAMVINPFTGIGALTVKAEPVLSGLVYANAVSAQGHYEDGKWIPDTYRFNQDIDEYSNYITMGVYEKWWVSFAVINGRGELDPLKHEAVSKNY